MKQTLSTLTLWVFLGAGWLISVPAAAADRPIPLAGESTSPDGRVEVSVVTSGEKTDDFHRKVKIKIDAVPTHQIVGAFDWPILDAPDIAPFEVLWSPDSTSFAINWENGPSEAKCAVFARSSSGWQRVPLPDLFKSALAEAKAVGEDRVELDNNKGEKTDEKVSAWLPDRCFRIEAMYLGLVEAGNKDHSLALFQYTFHLEEGKDTKKTHVVLKGLALAP